MKFLNIISLASDLWLCIKTAFRPTLSGVVQSPSLLLSPKCLTRLIFYNVWKTWGEGANEMSKELKLALITPHAHGVVLDIGAGELTQYKF